MNSRRRSGVILSEAKDLSFEFHLDMHFR